MTTSRQVGRTGPGPDILAHLPVERGSRTPLQEQIAGGIRRAILAGSFRAGQRLPSTRSLALELGVSRLPVLAAFEQLTHEGYLEARSGSGTYVSDALHDELERSATKPERPKPRSDTRAERHSASARNSDGGLLPFRMSLPALDLFPHEKWARVVARHAHSMTRLQMAYGDPAGVHSLRAAIAEHLRVARAVRCEAEDVLIVSGSQAAIRISAAALLARDDRIAVEDPGYPGARMALEASGARTVSVPVDDEGIDVTALAAESAIRAVYVTPSHQYPLGVSMSAARRLALLDWAARTNAWVIEDDYDSEYRYVSRPLGALQSTDTGDRVVYVGTFSKVLFPALRVGYIVVPRAHWSAFVSAREALDLFSPTLYQLALVDFLREGHFARHLRRMREVYASRRAALLEGLEKNCAGLLTVHNADAGLHVTTMLPPGVSDTRVLEAMARAGLTATALSSCYATPTTRSGLLLGFGGFSERRIGEATAVLGDTLRRHVLADASMRAAL